MNSAALYFASGDSLYPGAVLLLSALIASLLLRGRLRLLRSLATWLGVSMIVMACPPVSWWAAGILLASLLLWLIADHRPQTDYFWVRMRIAAAAILLVWLLAVPITELLHRRLPIIGGPAADHLVIIGDSISSGIDPHTPAWPVFFQQMTFIPVENLSRPGAGVVEARAMAARIQPQDTLVLIEIGGNDLLSDMPSAKFSETLDSLLGSLRTPGRILVMFELPLLPHKVGLGQAQRRLAAKYGVVLIPKHWFTRVLGGVDATSDGLHLSESGARQMAALVAQTLFAVLKPAGQSAH
jgi:acyl-CoA thioesterase I